MAKKKEAPNNLVKIKLFKDSGKYKDPLVVVLNGKIWRLERGIVLEVPKDVAEIISHSEYQDTLTANMVSSLEDEWEEKSKNLK